jgi:integrase
MVKRRRQPSQGWRTFLRNHAPDIAAMDLFVVPPISFDLLFAFVIVLLDRRALIWINVTRHPTAEWIARQITEAFPWNEAPRYLIRDRDRIFGGLLRAIASYEGAPETRAALELLALTFVRPGELRAAEWAEFDLEAGFWAIPAGKMKMRRAHRVPLAPQAVAVLRELYAITDGRKFLFPSIRSANRCMSENTINAALRRLGFKNDEMTAHDFRSAASSILNESGLWHADAIERQLAHVDNDSVRRAYARADFWEERVRMMRWWADRCDEMRRGGIVIPLRA